MINYSYCKKDFKDEMNNKYENYLNDREINKIVPPNETTSNENIHNKKKHQPTIFISPFNDPLGNLIEYAPDVDEGDIIIFPSMLTHYVLPNKSSDIRIILSFNVNIS